MLQYWLKRTIRRIRTTFGANFVVDPVIFLLIQREGYRPKPVIGGYMPMCYTHKMWNKK